MAGFFFAASGPVFLSFSAIGLIAVCDAFHFHGSKAV